MAFYSGFEGKEDIAIQFRGDNLSHGNADPSILKELEDAEILFASYGYISYEGDALVIFIKDGVLYEAHGGHCSCNGLEGQWSPEVTTFEAISFRLNDEWSVNRFKEVHGPEAANALLNVLLTYEVEKNILR